MTAYSIPVYISRHGLKASQPMDGRLVKWDIGERVVVTAGKDKGRIFVITSERRDHRDLKGPQPFVREGYFEDDPERTPWAKAEEFLWMR